MAFEYYNIGNEDNVVSIRELAKTLVNLFPEKHLEQEFTENVDPSYVPSTVSKNIPNSMKLRNKGWKPTYDIKTGFRRMIMSYEEENE